MKSRLRAYAQHFPASLKLAYPIMAGQLGQIAVNLADNIMVGRLGAASLAAVSLAHAIFVVFIVIGFGLSYALPPLVSEADGGGKSGHISKYFKHSLIINMVFAVFTVGALYAFNHWIQHLDQDPEVARLAQPYLLISGFSMLPLMAFQTLRTYADGLSNTKPAMIAIIAGNLINIALNYLLIFGKMGFPAMGVEGAALGSLIARVAMLCILLGILYNYKNLWLHIASSNFFSFSKIYYRKLLGIGIPSVLQGLFEISAFSGAALIMGMISKEAQAAHQIAISLASMTFLICTGLAMAATIQVGKAYGEKQWEKMQNVGMSNILLIMLFMSATTIGFLITRHILPTIYIDDPMVVGISSTLLIYAAIFQIPDGIQVTALGALRGIQDVKTPTVITFIAYWLVGIPISYCSVKYWNMGPEGVWIGLIIGLVISASLQTYRFLARTSGET